MADKPNTYDPKYFHKHGTPRTPQNTCQFCMAYVGTLPKCPKCNQRVDPRIRNG